MNTFSESTVGSTSPSTSRSKRTMPRNLALNRDPNDENSNIMNNSNTTSTSSSSSHHTAVTTTLEREEDGLPRAFHDGMLSLFRGDGYDYAANLCLGQRHYQYF